MHKVVNGTVPSYLVQVLSNAVNIDKHYNLQNDDDLFRTEIFMKSLFPDCVRKWNSPEIDLRKECTYNSFRSKITPIVNCLTLDLLKGTEVCGQW